MYFFRKRTKLQKAVHKNHSNNLIKNSVQALTGRNDGLIKIEIISETILYIIKISDNGPGIPEDKLDKIFLINFTTKSSGMGLGLTMAKSMIESMNGKIWFNSEQGRGVDFFISLNKVLK